MNLTQRPPRSPRVRLGGYVILPRMLDKCRAELAGTIGEYHFNSPLDQHFLRYTGTDAEALKAVVAKGLGDAEVLAWINANAAFKREPWEIAQWGAFREAAVPSDNESRVYINEMLAANGAAAREDLATWFDTLDLDDYVSFGGKP